MGRGLFQFLRHFALEHFAKNRLGGSFWQEQIMIWEIQQQAKIHRANESARNAENKVERVDTDVDEIRRHLERLSLACQSMWELIRERTDLTEEDLDQKILEVDGRDGRIDGKISRQIADCPHCGRKTNTRRDVCLMCGGELKRLHQFEG